MAEKNVAIRKRTQIAKANQTMFLWIAVASALIGAAIVVSIFMFQKLTFNEKVLALKQNTVTTLEQNNSVVEKLQSEIRVLDTNSALSSVKANPSDQTLQVILDALPADANSLALGASLQNKLLNGIDGLTLENLKMDSVIGVETLSGDGTQAPAEGANGNIITFQFTVQGGEPQLKKALENLEKSIRIFKINSVKLEFQTSGLNMVVQAQTYYEPAKTIELKNQVVKQ